MTSTADDGACDTGLLAPAWAGSPAGAATGDRAVLQALLDAEAALTRAQCATGSAPAAAGRTVTGAARAERFDARSLALRARGGGNPVIPLVADLTAAVARLAPDHAEFVHRGATSQDILDTALMLVAARTLDLITSDLERTADALARLAKRHRDTPMPGRTLTQHAVPTTFGLKAAGWRSLVLDAGERLTRVRSSLPVQLGGAAGTLAAFHTYAADADGTPGDPGLALTAAYAAELGLAEPLLPWHTLRTPVADLGGALAFTTGALGKIAADVLVLSRTEIGEAAEHTGGGSSAMPHKSNPVAATLIASAARRIPAPANVLLGSLAAEDERPAGAWHAEWEPLREALRLTGGAAHHAVGLCTGLRVFPDRMRAHLDLTGGRILTERLAAHLGPLLGRDTARRLLERASRRAARDGTTLADELRRDLRHPDPDPDPAVHPGPDPDLHSDPDLPADPDPDSGDGRGRADGQPAGRREEAGTRTAASPPGAGAAPSSGTGASPRPGAGDPAPEARAVLTDELLRELTDPLGHLGSAGALTDRALERHLHRDHR